MAAWPRRRGEGAAFGATAAAGSALLCFDICPRPASPCARLQDFFALCAAAAVESGPVRGGALGWAFFFLFLFFAGIAGQQGCVAHGRGARGPCARVAACTPPCAADLHLRPCTQYSTATTYSHTCMANNTAVDLQYSESIMITGRSVGNRYFVSQQQKP